MNFKTQSLKNFAYLFLLLTLFFNCTKIIYKTSSTTVEDNQYDTGFPLRDASKEFKKIIRSVVKIVSTSYYVSYSFEKADSIKDQDISKINLQKKAHSITYFNKSVSGTASLLSKNDRNYLFLTCAHVLNFQDTIIFHFPTPQGEESNIVKSVAIKVRQSNHIPGYGDAIVIASDRSNDLALIGYLRPRTLVYSPKPIIESLLSLNVKIGNANDLDWGDFVYVIGYPQGLKMVTRGIVSIPEQGRKKRILIDALFNQGASGSIVLAIRDGIPNFELVGIAHAVSAENESYLVPEGERKWDPTAPYSGKMYVKKRKFINYGITFIIPINVILKFIDEHKKDILLQGFNLPNFSLQPNEKAHKNTINEKNVKQSAKNMQETFQAP